MIRDKVKEWHDLLVKGMVNGLTHTIHDGRRDDINWVRGRLQLWEAFGRCMFNLEQGQNYQCDEKDLREIAEFGYRSSELTSGAKK